MKILDAIKITKICNDEVIKDMIDVLNKRKDDIEINEPISDGSYHDKWEEKIDELEQIIEDLENVLMINDPEKRNDKLEQIRIDMTYYQFMYGGLKRLTI